MEARELVSDATKDLPTTNVNLLVHTPPILSMHIQKPWIHPTKYCS
jgi:hypothetical protein